MATFLRANRLQEVLPQNPDVVELPLELVMYYMRLINTLNAEPLSAVYSGTIQTGICILNSKKTHLFNNDLLWSYSVTGAVLGAGDPQANTKAGIPETVIS